MLLFIGYGSLYPFHFDLTTKGGESLAHLLTTWRQWDHPADLLSNILLYIPFGFFGRASLSPRLPAPIRDGMTLAGGVLLSTTMELAQFYDQGRDSTLGDVYANAIGTAMGVLAARLLAAGQRWGTLRALAADRPAAAILVMWFGYRLYPYVPTIDPHKYLHALAAVVLEPPPGPLDCARFLLAWLVVAMVIDRLYGPRQVRTLFPLLACGEFLGRVLILDTTLTLKDVTGAAGAFLIWHLVLQHWTSRVRVLAVAVALLVVAERLAPFSFAPQPLRGFGWVPALSLMQGSIGIAMQAFCEKVFTYGGLIWLCWRSGLGLSVASIAVTALLLGTGYAQMWLPDRSAEVTDAVLAVVVGSVFGRLTRSLEGVRQN